MPLKRNRVLESDIKKEETETETDKQWTDSTCSQPCVPLIYSFTGGGRMLQPQATPQGRPTPSTSQLRVQNGDH